jgi:hypothetical protein
MNRILKIALYGFLAWLVPFAISFLFYSPQGELATDIFFFKTIMILVGSITAAALIVKYFKDVKKRFVTEALVIGLAWFAISIILDLVILLPMSGMSISDYFTQIGLRYLAMPIMSLTVGFVLKKKIK